ncbi:MAG: SDR family oxidoreductase [Pseudomonadota bacterium]
METTSPKRALITGGAHRIGRAIAEDLAAAGYDVAVHANRSGDAAEDLAATLSKTHGVRTAVVRGDLAAAGDVAALVPAATAALGPLGVLVNNASIFEEDSIETLDSDHWRRHMAVNAEAPAVLTRAFAEAFEGGGGVGGGTVPQPLGQPASGLVVNITDQRVWKPTPRFLSYSASKATLWWLTRTMAQALAPRVRVVALGPGPIIKAANQTDADFAGLVSHIPMQRAPAREDFGATIRFVHQTPSITGQMIALDGGQHLAWQTPDALVVE